MAQLQLETIPRCGRCQAPSSFRVVDDAGNTKEHTCRRHALSALAEQQLAELQKKLPEEG